MKFNLRDLMWLTLTVALMIALLISSRQITKQRLLHESTSRELALLQAQLKEQSAKMASASTKTRDLERIVQSKQAGDFFVYRGLELQKQNRHTEAAASFVIAAEKHPKNLFIINKIIECFERTHFEDKLKHWTEIRDDVVREFEESPWQFRRNAG